MDHASGVLPANMASRKEPARGQVDIALEVSPDVVDAGAEIILHARVVCSPSGDLVGHTLKVKDESGADAGVLELTDTDDEENATGAAALKAPVKAGAYVWSVVSPAVVKDGVSYAESVEADFIHRQASHDTRSGLGYSVHCGCRRPVHDQGRHQVFERVLIRGQGVCNPRS